MRYTNSKYIQLIHIAKQQLKIDSETYRLMLVNLTGKDSTKKMKIAELDNVLAHLENKGFKTTTKSGYKTAFRPVKHDIAKKIQWLWNEMHKQGIVKDGSEQALNTFVRNTINPVLKRQGKNLMILNVQSLDYQNGALVLERMKKWQQRTE